MKRLRRSDRVWLAITLPIWAVGFVLSVYTMLRPTAFSPLWIADAAGPNDYPVIIGFRHWGGEPSGLRAGDRLISAAGQDFRGAGRFEVFPFIARNAGPDFRIKVAFERDGVRRETILRAGSFSVFWPRVLTSVSFVLVAVVLLLRAPPSPMVRTTFRALMIIGIQFVNITPLSTLTYYSGIVVHLAAYTLWPPFALRALLVFPHGRAAETPLVRFGPWIFTVLGPLEGSQAFGLFLSPMVGRRAFLLTQMVLMVIMLGVITRNYRREDAVGRRQWKLAMFGFYCGAVPILVASLLAVLDPEFRLLFLFSQAAMNAFPIAILISIVRYNLFDIDRVISATASYNVLAVLLIAVGLAVVPSLAEASANLAGLNPFVGQVTLSLLLAAVVIPAHRRLRPQIDRLFFQERFNIDRGIEALLRKLSECSGPSELTERVGTTLQRIFRPDACVIYARVEQSYAPVFVEGRTVPPAFSGTGPMIATLRDRDVPLATRDPAGRHEPGELSAFDRAALETLDAALVVPVRRNENLLAFVCLGGKRSGDVYTTTDVTLLTALAEKVSSELTRFEDSKLLRQATEMQAALRRYVPGAVAEQITSGEPLSSAEREVSVLFVDIRGYTSFSESRRAEEIFSTVNRYTETVSEQVRAAGGSVVEFNGDGMMAIFGAPGELADKERAAVRAAREIYARVAAMPEEEVAGPAGIRVGVGIATGEAFVGNVRAVDRMIWTAIGNTVNLAARLQSLTRDFDVAVAIDAAVCLCAFRRDGWDGMKVRR
jgi:class 3 adenylate cyclase